jgi:di/tricarboxylate transporter
MDAFVVTVIALAAFALFVSGVVPPDVTAMGVLVALVLTGVLAPEEALRGFSDQAVLTIAAMFLLSAGLSATGAISRLGSNLTKLAEKRPGLLLPVLMLTMASISAFINNTAAMAILLPMTLGLARRHQQSPSRLLMPLSFASQWGGLVTLIGTSTNIVVHSFLLAEGMGGLGMFELAPLGLVLTLTGLLYMTLIGHRLIPARRDPGDLATAMHRRGYLGELLVTEGSPLVGSSLGEADLAERFNLRVLAVFRDSLRLLPDPEIALEAGDILMVRGDVDELIDSVGFKGLRLYPAHKLAQEEPAANDLVFVEAMVGPRSWLSGRTVKELDFRRRYRAIVVAVQRRGALLHRQLGDVPLRLGDTLLLQVQRRDIERLRRERNLVVLGEAGQQPYRPGKAFLAGGVIAGVVLLNALGLLPLVVAALLGVGVMVVSRCLPYEDMYRAIDWSVILLLGGMFSLGTALQKTGLAAEVSGAGVGLLEPWGGVAVLAGVYVMTALMTQAMSNSASALIMAPIALAAAEQLQASARPFLIVVAVAASAEFLTPVGYQTNTMIYGPGGYHFLDYTRAGLPLSVIFFALTMLLVPLLWPF